MDRTWRVIHHGQCDAYWNMAVDEALLASFSDGICPPTIRFYTWDRPSISLGRFQQIDRSIDRAFCSARGIPIVRRPTGGRAVLHGTDLTFSVVKRDRCATVAESYARLSHAVTQALLSLGVPVEPFAESSDSKTIRSTADCFALQAGFEVALNGKKVLGCAQVRAEGNILQQNSLILQAPSADNVNAFIGSCLDESNSCIAQYTAGEAVKQSILMSMGRVFGITIGESEMTAQERQFAQDLLDSKYGQRDWNLFGTSRRSANHR